MSEKLTEEELEDKEEYEAVEYSSDDNLSVANHWLRIGKPFKIAMGTPKAWRYIEGLLTMNPGIELTIKRVGNYFELRRVADETTQD